MEYTIFSGTNSVRNSRGIYRIWFDGKQARILDTVQTYNSGYLALNRAGTRLYAVSEGMSFAGRASGAVLAYDISGGTPQLINYRLSQGQRPCCIELSPDDKTLAAANFFGGSLVFFPTDDEKGLLEASRCIREVPEKGRLNGMHGTAWLPDGRIAAVYLGTGSILLYSARNFTLSARYDLPKDIFPRHITCSPDGRFLYLIRQDISEIWTFSLPADGSINLIGVTPVTGDDGAPLHLGATAKFSPDGQLLFASSRLEHSVSVFLVDPNSGVPTQAETHRLKVKMPRDIAVTPDGKHLVTAGQASDSIEICRIDSKNARLEELLILEDVVSPGCIAIKEGC